MAKRKKNKHEPHDAQVPAASATAGQETEAGPSSKMKRRSTNRRCAASTASWSNCRNG